MGNAIDGLYNLKHIRLTVRVILSVTWRHVIVDNLALKELTLEVGRYPVYAMHLTTVTGSIREEGARGGYA